VDEINFKALLSFSLLLF